MILKFQIIVIKPKNNINGLRFFFLLILDEETVELIVSGLSKKQNLDLEDKVSRDLSIPL